MEEKTFPIVLKFQKYLVISGKKSIIQNRRKEKKFAPPKDRCRVPMSACPDKCPKFTYTHRGGPATLVARATMLVKKPPECLSLLFFLLLTLDEGRIVPFNLFKSIR